MYAPVSSIFRFSCFWTARPCTPTPAKPNSLERFSFLTADPVSLIRSKGRNTEVRHGEGGWSSTPDDALSVARSLLPHPPLSLVPGIPPFQGGIAGYIGYDWGAVLERLPVARYDDLAVPDVILGLYDWVIAWDHRRGTAWLISTGLPEEGIGREHRARQRMKLVRERLVSGARAGRRTVGSAKRVPDSLPVPTGSSAPAPTYPAVEVEGGDVIGLRSTFTRRGYLDAVARVREYIVAGDIFQANLSQRFQTPASSPAFSALPAATPAESRPLFRLSGFRRATGPERIPRAVSPTGSGAA